MQRGQRHGACAVQGFQLRVALVQRACWHNACSARGGFKPGSPWCRGLAGIWHVRHKGFTPGFPRAGGPPARRAPSRAIEAVLCVEVLRACGLAAAVSEAAAWLGGGMPPMQQSPCISLS